MRTFLSAVSAGLIASLADSILFTVARIVGLTSYSKEFLFAKPLVGFTESPAVWLLGLMVSLVLGGLIGWFYALGFQAVRKKIRSGWDTGIAFGVVHWLIAGLMLGYLTSAGFFGSELGWPTFMLIFASHLLYGAIVGGLYLPPSQVRERLEKDELENTRHAEVFTRKAS